MFLDLRKFSRRGNHSEMIAFEIMIVDVVHFPLNTTSETLGHPARWGFLNIPASLPKLLSLVDHSGPDPRNDELAVSARRQSSFLEGFRPVLQQLPPRDGELLFGWVVLRLVLPVFHFSLRGECL